MKLRDTTLWSVTAFWFALCLAGAWAWERYETTPGTVGAVDAGDQKAPGRWQITVYAHPHCPCTKATLAELAAIAAAAPELAIRVRIVRPFDTPDRWARGQTWESAIQIANCDVDFDAGGTEARHYGAETSGFTVLIDPAGRIAYRGGLTPGRGRQGEGPSAILAILAGGPAPTTAVPVYGCSLFTPEN